MIKISLYRFALVFGLTLLSFNIGAQTTFSNYFIFGMNNPMLGTTFTNCHELSNQNGYLLMAEKYTSASIRNTILIRTDIALTETWSTMISFNQAAAPYDNINFSNVGELLNGNYYVFGETGLIGRPTYVIFVFDTNGNVIDYTAIRDTLNISNGHVLPQIQIAADSSIIISLSEHERFGFYRLDQQLNVISSGIYNANSIYGMGRACLLLPDTTLLFDGYANFLTLTKTTTSGTIIWSKSYPSIGNGFSLCQLGGSIYVGGTFTPSTAAVAYVAKFDTSGALIWYHTYLMANSWTMSAIWNIYPNGNNLMLYSDSVMFEIDTLGFPVGTGFTVNSNNYKVLKPCTSNEFMLAGPIYQDVFQDYRHTLMRFDMNTVSSCLAPRAIVTTVSTSSTVPIQPMSVPHFIQIDTINYYDTTVQLGYDMFHGCSPNSISENSGTLHTPSIFPNPASDVLTVRYTPQDLNAKLLFEITDVSGRVIKSESIEFNGENEFRLSVSHISEGIYTISIYENGVAAGHSLCCIKH